MISNAQESVHQLDGKEKRVAIVFRSPLTDDEAASGDSTAGLCIGEHILVMGYDGGRALSTYLGRTDDLNLLTRKGIPATVEQTHQHLNPHANFCDICSLGLPVAQTLLNLIIELHDAYTRLSGQDYLTTTVPVGARGDFRFYLYVKYAKSSDGTIFLTASQVASSWDIETCHKVLKYAGKDDRYLARALSRAWSDLKTSLNVEDDSRAKYGKWRYWMVPSTRLPECYVARESDKAAKIAFYPYNILRELGFPALSEYENC